MLVAGDADFVPAAKLGREHAHSLTANMAPDLLQSLKDDAEAFEVIAKAGDDEELFHLIAPIVAGIDLTQGEFNQWINEYKYQRPAFWGNAEQQPADKTVRHRRTNMFNGTFRGRSMRWQRPMEVSFRRPICRCLSATDSSGAGWRETMSQRSRRVNAFCATTLANRGPKRQLSGNRAAIAASSPLTQLSRRLRHFGES